jgi:hypothetical protein
MERLGYTDNGLALWNWTVNLVRPHRAHHVPGRASRALSRARWPCDRPHRVVRVNTMAEKTSALLALADGVRPQRARQPPRASNAAVSSECLGARIPLVTLAFQLLVLLTQLTLGRF